jgi:hypothetical protein
MEYEAVRPSQTDVRQTGVRDDRSQLLRNDPEAHTRDLEARLQQALGRAAEAEASAALVQQRLDAVLSSTSWRLSSPIRVVGSVVGGSKGIATRSARTVVLHAAAYVRNRPELKQRLAAMLSRLPWLRARLIRLAGFDAIRGVVTGASVPVVETVDRLTARGRKIHADLLLSQRRRSV